MIAIDAQDEDRKERGWFGSRAGFGWEPSPHKQPSLESKRE